MIQNVLREIGGIGVYGAISICLFFVVFMGAVVLAACMSRATAEARGALPLEDGTKTSPDSGEGVAHE